MIKSIIALILAVPTILFAQEAQESTNTYKASSGETTLELQFKPFGENPIGLNGIRARKFTSDRTAMRLNVFLGIDSDSQITQNENSEANAKELRNKNFVFTINARPGIEKHLKGTERLSPYFGWEADIAYRTSSIKNESQVRDEVKFTKRINETGFLRLGANAIAGIDYYVTKKLYLGTEFGFGLAWTKLLSIKVKSDIDGFEEPDPVKRGSSFDLGPNVNAQIRLGYAF